MLCVGCALFIYGFVSFQSAVTDKNTGRYCTRVLLDLRLPCPELKLAVALALAQALLLQQGLQEDAVEPAGNPGRSAGGDVSERSPF